MSRPVVASDVPAGSVAGRRRSRRRGRVRSNPIRLRGRGFFGVHALARVYHHLVLLAHVARAVVVVAGVVEIVAPREVVGVFVGVLASAVPFVRPVSIRGVRVVRVETREVVRVLP